MKIKINTSLDIRDAFFDELYRLAVSDKSVMLLTADMGAMSLDKFRKKIPKQYLNVGIAEQNMVSIAAGLALTGKKVFIYAIAPFVTMRCYEQIKVDLSGMGLAVVIIGAGPGVTYASDGATHHAVQDLSIMRALPGFEIYNPADYLSSSAVAKIAYKASNPVYVRLDKGKFPNLYDTSENFQQGLSLIKKGQNILLISTGIMMHRAMELTKELSKEQLNLSLIDLYRIKPLNKALLVSYIKQHNCVVSLEEHSLVGGIGSAISEVITDENIDVSLKRFGLNDIYCSKHGSRDWIQAYHGLGKESLCCSVSAWKKSVSDTLCRDVKRLDENKFAQLIGVPLKDLPQDCRKVIKQSDLRYEVLQGAKKEGVVLNVLKRLEIGQWSISGKKKRGEWEKGWHENLKNFKNKTYDITELVPKYVRSNQPIRMEQEYVLPLDEKFEFNWYTAYRLWFFQSFFKKVRALYEFGCGSGYNLPIMAKLFPEMKIHGLDWVEPSKVIVDNLAKVHGLNVEGHLFDMFAPDKNLKLLPESGVLTMGALEQLGDNYGYFLNYLLENTPQICVHMEPLIELYDENSLFDHLAIRYHKKRNYLGFFLKSLKQLEIEGKAEIIKIHRVPFGSLFHEGYSYVVWKPKKKIK